MKKFSFPLDRVLAWRRSVERLEEMKLERLNADRSSLEARRKFIDEQASRALVSTARGGPVTGRELKALDLYRKSVASQRSRLNDGIAAADKKIAAQAKLLLDKRREVRLIERLRGDRVHKWQADFQKEIDQQAEESHLAKRNSALF